MLLMRNKWMDITRHLPEFVLHWTTAGRWATAAIPYLHVQVAA